MNTQNAWAFVLDGHVFYVLPEVEGKTLVCDLSTGQWHRWFTGAHPYWNAFRGIMWGGRSIAADDAGNVVWEVDPNTMLDEETLQIERTVTGFQPIRGRNSVRQGSLRLTASVGTPTDPDAKIRMRFSDDEGETWSRYYEVALEEGNFAQRVEYRSLGRLRAPGRIWEISDVGGSVCIEGMDSRLEGQ